MPGKQKTSCPGRRRFSADPPFAAVSALANKYQGAAGCHRRPSVTATSYAATHGIDLVKLPGGPGEPPGVPRWVGAPAAAAVAYREWAPPPALAPWVRRVWELTVPGPSGPGRVLPDGCMDIVVLGGTLLVARTPVRSRSRAVPA